MDHSIAFITNRFQGFVKYKLTMTKNSGVDKRVEIDSYDKELFARVFLESLLEGFFRLEFFIPEGFF